jgi:hypothetical protein
MALDAMILMGAQMAIASLVAISGPKKSQLSGSTPSNGQSNGFAPIKLINSEFRMKNQYIGTSMYMSLARFHLRAHPFQWPLK